MTKEESSMSVVILRGQQRLYRQNDPDLYTLLGWMRNLDGKHITDLVIASPTV